MLKVRIFQQVYYTVAVLALAVAACLPWLRPLSYQVLGYPPALADAGTFEAFQAHLAATSLSRRFLIGMLGLALTLGALSLAALVLRVHRRIHVPWLLIVATIVGSAGLAGVGVAGLTVGTCC